MQLKYNLIPGMLAGYILHRVKKPPRVPFLVNLLLWLLSLFILFIIVFGVWNGQLSVFMTSFYVSLGHTGKKHSNFIYVDFHKLKI